VISKLADNKLKYLKKNNSFQIAFLDIEGHLLWLNTSHKCSQNKQTNRQKCFLNIAWNELILHKPYQYDHRCKKCRSDWSHRKNICHNLCFSVKKYTKNVWNLNKIVWFQMLESAHFIQHKQSVTGLEFYLIINIFSITIP